MTVHAAILSEPFDFRGQPTRYSRLTRCLPGGSLTNPRSGVCTPKSFEVTGDDSLVTCVPCSRRLAKLAEGRDS